MTEKKRSLKPESGKILCAGQEGLGQPARIVRDHQEPFWNQSRTIRPGQGLSVPFKDHQASLRSSSIYWLPLGWLTGQTDQLQATTGYNLVRKDVFLPRSQRNMYACVLLVCAMAATISTRASCP